MKHYFKYWLLLSISFVAITTRSQTTNTPCNYAAYDKNTYLNKADCYFQNKMYAEAASNCATAYNFGLSSARTSTVQYDIDWPTNSTLWIIWVNSLLNAKDYDGALAKSNAYIELKPSEYAGYYWLCRSLYYKKDYNSALTAADKAASLGSKEVSFWKGMIYNETNDVQKAKEAFEKAIKLEPEKFEAYIQLGLIYRKESNISKMTEIYELACTNNPKNPIMAYYGAWMNFFAGKYTRAIELSDKFIFLTSYGGIKVNLNVKKEGSKINAYLEGVNNNNDLLTAGFKESARIIAINRNSIYNVAKTEDELKEYVIKQMKGEIGSELEIKVEQEKKIYVGKVKRVIIYTKEAAGGFGSRSIFNYYASKASEGESDYNQMLAIGNAENELLATGVNAYFKKDNASALAKLKTIEENSLAYMIKALVLAQNGDILASLTEYNKIPKEDLTEQSITLYKNRTELFTYYKPWFDSHKSKAETALSNGKQKEALTEYSLIARLTDGNERAELLKKMFNIVSLNPSAGEISEEARKYALRSEMLVKEGDFAGAEKELLNTINLAPYDAKLYFNMAIINAELKHYKEAIDYMKIYVDGVPDATNNRQAKDEIIKWEFMLERGK